MTEDRRTQSPLREVPTRGRGPIRALQFICPTGFFGAERWIVALARSLDPSRVDCRLAVTEESASQDLEVCARLEQMGCVTYRIRAAGRFDPRLILRLRGILVRDRIDILHTHGYKSDILGLLAARLAGVRCVATPHGFENGSDAKLQFYIRLGCLSLMHFDIVAPLSEELAGDMVRIGIRADRNRLIVNGVDLHDVEEALRGAAPPRHGADGEKRIAYVGQLAQRKNLGDMILAFDLLHRDRPNTRLLLMGEGRQRAELEALAQSLACAGHVEFLGYRDDRLTLLRNCHLFAMTSSLEGIPRAMMEAMGLGLPVGAFRIPGVDKLVIPGETGLLADFGDVGGLKTCWERVLFEDGAGEVMGQNARAHVLAHFSAGRMAEEYTTLYEGMLGFSR